MHQYNKHSWSQRNKFIVPFLNEQSSIIDYGCGHKDILNYYKPTKYLGIDLNPSADIVVDLNNFEPIYFGYDYGLILGVLEYLNNPFTFLNKVSTTADKFIILNFIRGKRKKAWKQSFSLDQLLEEYGNVFNSVLNYKVNNKYDIFLCSKSHN